MGFSPHRKMELLKTLVNIGVERNNLYQILHITYFRKIIKAHKSKDVRDNKRKNLLQIWILFLLSI